MKITKILTYLLLPLLFFILNASAIAKPLIRVGTPLYYPPFIMLDASQHIYGFDVELTQMICTQLDMDCIFVPMPFHKLFDTLTNNQIDAAVGSISITQERLAMMNFTIPYMSEQGVFLGLKKLENVPEVTANYLRGKRVGILERSIFQQFINQNFPTADVATYETTFDLLAALAQDKVQIIFVDAPVAAFWVNQGRTMKIIGKKYNFGFGIAFAVNKNNPALLQQFNRILINILPSPEYHDLVDKYFTFIPRRQ